MIGGIRYGPTAAGVRSIIRLSGKADIIFSKNSSSWGSFFYSQDEDQLRVSVTSEEITNVERLTFDFVDIDNTSAVVVLDWEKKRFPFKVEFAVNDIVLANAENELRNTAGFGWQGPASAAQYALQNEIELDKALAWADQSIAAQQNFNNLSLKSQIQSALGNSEDSKATMELALNDPAAGAPQYYAYGRQLIGQEKNEEAMAIFTKLSKKWPDHWLAPHGLARGYSRAGDYKKALKYEREALEKCPEGSKGFLTGFVAQLEKGEDFTQITGVYTCESMKKWVNENQSIKDKRFLKTVTVPAAIEGESTLPTTRRIDPEGSPGFVDA